MAEKMPQTYANHVKWVPMFHFVTMPLVLINLLYSIYRVAQGVGAESIMALVVAFVLANIALFSRVNALKAQDRVIRLEERLRMQALLPDELRPRINDVSTGQAVALRFASDEELPALVRKALDEGADQKTIKQAIQTWRPDYQRV